MASRLGQGTPLDPVGPKTTMGFWPQSRLGWWSVGLTVAALVYWSTWWRVHILIDVFGKWVGVAGACVLAGLAVAALVVAARRERERALLPFICLTIIVVTALFWVLFLAGERVFSH